MRRHAFTWAVALLVTGGLLAALLLPAAGAPYGFAFLLLPPAAFELCAPARLIQFTTVSEPARISGPTLSVEAPRAPPA